MKLLRFLLFPFSIVYNTITSIRNCFFDIGVFKSASFPTPIIAVGNLSVGGTGKSPQIEYLIRLLKNDYKIAVLSRGYKRKTKGFQLVSQLHTTDDIGDEPMQFYKKFGKSIYVAVDANRKNGIQQLLALKNPPEVILLDDAYQHRKVKASTYILLTKFDDLFINDFVLPTGNLRESRRGVKRADAIVVTKCPKNVSVLEQDEIVRRLAPKKNQEVFFSTIMYDEILGGGESITIQDISEGEVLLVTGIANPSTLLTYLESRKIKFKHLKFPDHHHFSKEDILKIKTSFKDISSHKKNILTTEKDFVRLEGKIENLLYITIKNTILNSEDLFKSFVYSEVKKLKK